MNLEKELRENQLRFLRERAQDYFIECQQAMVRNDGFFVARYSGSLEGLALGSGDPAIASMSETIAAQVHAWLKTQSEQAERDADQ